MVEKVRGATLSRPCASPRLRGTWSNPMSTSSQVPFTSILSSSFLAIILWLIGFVMAGIGGHELLTALRCGDEPAPITVAELAHRGPTQGDYVTLTDFDINWDGYVYWQDEHGNWTTCDVPLWAAGS